jgi:hypothetical protein
MKVRSEREAAREERKRRQAQGYAVLDAYWESEHPPDHIDQSPPTTIRPDSKVAQTWWLKFVQGGVVTVGGLSLAYVTGGHSASVLYGLVTAAVLFPGGYLALRRALRVEELSLAPGGGVTYRNWVGRTRTVSHDAIARVVLEAVNVSTVMPRPAKRYLFLVDGQGRCRLRVLVSIFVADEVRRFAHAIGSPVDDSAEVVRPLRMRQKMPGSFPWVSAHPWLGAFAAIPLVIGLIILLVVLFPTHNG